VRAIKVTSQEIKEVKTITTTMTITRIMVEIIREITKRIAATTTTTKIIEDSNLGILLQQIIEESRMSSSKAMRISQIY